MNGAQTLEACFTCSCIVSLCRMDFATVHCDSISGCQGLAGV